MKAAGLDDIIAAVSTPAGSGGIGIVRMSGKGCIDVADRIFKSEKGYKLSERKSHTISFGHIVNPLNGEVADEVLVSIMKAPNTYTKEDVAEINCHGGFTAVNKVLELCINNGARHAEPGEFTKRAFLNGRIDLSQAEAVIDIINSKTDLGRQSAVSQLEGSVKNKMNALRDELLTTIATIEAAIDYPEHDIEEETYRMLYEKTTGLIKQVENLLETADKGKIIREGISTVILGKPNVGKSSLLNALLREERAIVTDIPGTTRDTVEEYVNIGGVPVKIIDTAGIRDTSDKVEKIGVEKSLKIAENADLILMLADLSRPFDDEDKEILSLIKGRKAIVILNKTDLPPVLDIKTAFNDIDEGSIIAISAKTGEGIDTLTAKLKEMFFGGELEINNSVVISNVRHKNSLFAAKESLERALNTIEIRMPEDFVSMDLKEAYDHLGEITGDSIEEDLLDKIFTQFCLGK
jgi:tRNA modification GTPase